MASPITKLRQQLESQVQSERVNLAVTKTDEELHFTLGVMYVPGALDADDEFVDATDLQKAVWGFVRKSNRRVRDTHSNKEIGELVEIVTWPYEVETEMKLGDGTIKKVRLPANTVFAGVRWDDEVWPLVKSGKIRGYSMGGRAIRMKEAATDEELPRMSELIVQPEAVAATKTHREGQLLEMMEQDPVFKTEFTREYARELAARLAEREANHDV